MRVLRSFLALLLACMPLVASVQDQVTAIKAVLEKQAADWNHGDLNAFAASYKNSPDILFVGPTIEHGYAAMLKGYQTRYPSREAMGSLTFSELAIQRLDSRFATATGRFHLERSPLGGGNANGYFLLVLEKTSGGWKIIRDDTTALPSTR